MLTFFEITFLKNRIDFWQYHGGQHGSNNPGCTGEFMRDLFKDLANAIKSELPNAVISWDVSAWIGEQGMRTWWGYFKDLGLVDIVHTSGGQVFLIYEMTKKIISDHL
jgi:hypothetical protein